MSGSAQPTSSGKSTRAAIPGKTISQSGKSFNQEARIQPPLACPIVFDERALCTITWSEHQYHIELTVRPNNTWKRLSLSSMGKVTHRGFFFSPQGEVSPRAGFTPPRVVFTHERSEGCNWHPRGPFLAFLLKMSGRGCKTHFWFKKLVGHFFLGGVKKHELGVGNYRINGRKPIFLRIA